MGILEDKRRAKLAQDKFNQIIYNNYARYAYTSIPTTAATIGQTLQALWFPVKLKKNIIKVKRDKIRWDNKEDDCLIFADLLGRNRVVTDNTLGEYSRIRRFSNNRWLFGHNVDFSQLKPGQTVDVELSSPNIKLPIVRATHLHAALQLGEAEYTTRLKHVGVGSSDQLYALCVPWNVADLMEVMTKRFGINPNTDYRYLNAARLFDQFGVQSKTYENTIISKNQHLGYPNYPTSNIGICFILFNKDMEPVISLSALEVYYSLDMRGFTAIKLNEVASQYIAAVSHLFDDVDRSVILGLSYYEAMVYCIDRYYFDIPIQRPTRMDEIRDSQEPIYKTIPGFTPKPTPEETFNANMDAYRDKKEKSLFHRLLGR